MQVPWFFATTHAPQRQTPAHGRRPANHHPIKRLVIRAIESFVAWGERSRRRHSGAESLI